MKVCLIGNGLTTLSLGKNLINKKIKVFNGKLESRLLHFQIYEGSKKAHKFK